MHTHQKHEARTTQGRRDFLRSSVGALAFLALGDFSANARAAASPYSLPPLPYAMDALDPILSANTLGFHYGKHHKGYVDNLNRLLAGNELAGLPLEKIT